MDLGTGNGGCRGGWLCVVGGRKAGRKEERGKGVKKMASFLERGCEWGIRLSSLPTYLAQSRGGNAP